MWTGPRSDQVGWPWIPSPSTVNIGTCPVIRVFLINRHPPLLHGLERVLAEQESFRLVGAEQSVSSAFAKAATLLSPPDVVVFATGASDPTIFDTIEQLSELPGSPPILVASNDDSGTLALHAFAAGADGFEPIEAETEQLVRGIKMVAAGTLILPKIARDELARILQPKFDAQLQERLATLTRTERRVLEFVAIGKSNKQIARKMRMAVPTVKSHVTVILRKLNLDSRSQIAAYLNGTLNNEPPDDFA